MTESALKAEIENLSEVKRKLRVVVPSDEVTQEVERAYRDLGKRAKVKGFRPGKVPRSILEMYYGKQVEQEVSESLVRRSLAEVLKEKDLEPVNLSWPEPMPPPVAGEDYRLQRGTGSHPGIYRGGLPGTGPAGPGSGGERRGGGGPVGGDPPVQRPAEASGGGPGAQEGTSWSWITRPTLPGSRWKAAKSEGTYMEVGSGKFNEEFEGNLMGLQGRGGVPLSPSPCPTTSPTPCWPARWWTFR